MYMRPLIVLATLLLAAGAWARGEDVSPEPPPDAACQLSGSAGKAVLTGGPKGIVVDLTGGESYLQGKVTLAFKSAPPGRVTFRFANLRTLTSFSFSDGKRVYRFGSGWSGGKDQIHFGADGKPVNSAARAAVSITMHAMKVGSGIEVVVLNRGPDMGKTVEAQWRMFEGRIFGFPDS
jgi:hypothetical protein